MFGLFKKKQAKTGVMVIVEMNARCMPMDRAIWEDPLDELLKARGLGEVTGGGSLQNADGEIEHSDTELMIAAASDENLQFLVATLEDLGAPKNSKLTVPDLNQAIVFGKNEGLGLYLNGTDLPDEVYKNTDVNEVIANCSELLSPHGKVYSAWNGPRETAF